MANIHPHSIGILDSGVGGLSVLLEIQRLLPQVDIHYVGDSAWCPYGSKPSEQICQRVTAISHYLIECGVSLIVVACNSATIHAVEVLRNTFSIPIVGMEPAIKPAVSLSRSGTIGVLATEASIAGRKFHHLLNTHGQRPGVRIITQPCPDFVTLVEAGITQGEKVDAAIRQYALPLVDQGADTLVLGCTHYPFLKQCLQRLVGDNVQLLDSGAAVARRTASLIDSDQTNKSACAAELNVHTTGELNILQQVFPALCPSVQAKLHQLIID